MVFLITSFIFMIAFFMFILYQIFINKKPKETLKNLIMPGSFFFLTWGIIYFFIFK